MRSRGSAPPLRETGTGTATRPGTRALVGRTERDERHDPNGHPTHPGSSLDTWIRELAEAAPPLTPAQRHTLALLLTTPGPVPTRSGGAAAPDRTP